MFMPQFIIRIKDLFVTYYCKLDASLIVFIFVFLLPVGEIKVEWFYFANEFRLIVSVVSTVFVEYIFKIHPQMVC